MSVFLYSVDCCSLRWCFAAGWCWWRSITWASVSKDWSTWVRTKESSLSSGACLMVSCCMLQQQQCLPITHRHCADTVQTLCSSSGLQPVSSLTFNDTDIVNWINCQCHRLCIPGSNLCVCRRTLGGVSPLPASPAVHVVRGRCVAPVGLLAPGSRPVCSRQQARCQHAAKPETDCSADLGGPPGPPTGTTVWWTLLPCSCSHCVYHTNSVRTEMRTWYVFRLTSPVLLLLLASESFTATFLHTW